jgi:translocation and assembly module TamB
LPGDTPLSLGLEQLRLDATVVNDAIDATLALQSRAANGSVQANIAALDRNAALKLDGRIQIASLRVLDPLIGTNALVKGQATLVVAGAGTLSAPQITGTLAAANLAIEAPQYGVRLREGTLRAELTATSLVLREFSIFADEGRISASGVMSRADGGERRLDWRADNVRVLNRPDMRLKVDGGGTAALADKKLVLRGGLKAIEGHFQFDRPQTPRLGSDVVVIGRPRAAGGAGLRSRFETQLLDVDVTLEAGDRLHLVGAGLDTYLTGKLHLKTSPRGVLEARGVLSGVRGVYYALGQRLEIERGRLIFDGPLDNPALDVLAKRRHLPVEAGVQVTGTVRVPSITLVSDPPVSDSEKLSWLTLGHGLQDATGADLGLLQAAASALVSGGNSVPITQRIANRIGLDELSLRGSGAAGSQVAAFGKRLSDKLYVEYEQGLAATSSVLRLSYLLTRSLSLRLEAGFSSGVGLFFTRSYD